MTPAELRQRMDAYPLTPDELARRVGVTPGAVRNWLRGDRAPVADRAAVLERLFAKREGCVCSCHGGSPHSRAGVPLWTADEHEALRRLVLAGGDPDEVVNALLREFGRRRTRRAIVERARRMGLTFMRHHGSERVMRLLGISRYRLEQLIHRELLPVQRHVGIASGNVARWWRVDPADLEAFVERYAGTEVDPSRIRDRDLKALAEDAAIRNGRRAS
jgi:hypothetical protein